MFIAKNILHFMNSYFFSEYSVLLTCLRTRTVRVRTRSTDVNYTRHNFVMHAHNDDVKANVTYT